MSNLAKIFVVGVALAAVAALATLPMDGAVENQLTFGALVVLSLVSGSRAVHVASRNIRVTPGDAFTFASLLAVGPVAAPVVALSSVVGSAFTTERPLSMKTLFNFSMVTLSGSFAGWTFAVLNAAGTGNAVLAVGAAAGVFFLINTSLVAFALRIERGNSFFTVWRQSGLWTATSTLANCVLALGLQSALVAVGPLALAVGFSGTAVISGSYRLHRARIQREEELAASVLGELREQVESGALAAAAAELPERDDERPHPVDDVADRDRPSPS